MRFLGVLTLFVSINAFASPCTPTAFRASADLSPPMEPRQLSPRFVNPDQMLYSDSNGRIYSHNFVTKKTAPFLPTTKDKPFLTNISPDNTQIITLSSDKKHLSSYNIKTGKLEKTITVPECMALNIDDVGTIHLPQGHGSESAVQLPDLILYPPGKGPHFQQIFAKDPAKGLSIQSIYKETANGASSQVLVYSHSKLIRTIDKGVSDLDGYESGKLVQMTESKEDGHHLKITDIYTGRVEKRITPDYPHPYGKQLLFEHNGWLINPVTNEKVAPATATYIDVASGEADAYCVPKSGDAQIYDQKTKKLVNTLPGVDCSDIASYNRTHGLITNMSGTPSYNLTSVCIFPDIMIDSNPRSFCNVVSKKGVADALFQKTICETPYSEAMAKSMKIDPLKKTYSILEAENYLKFLSKPGAFKLGRDMNFLNATLHSPYAKEHPENVQDALAGILATDPVLYSDLTLPQNKTSGRNLAIFTTAPSHTLTLSKACGTASEQVQVQSAVKKLFNDNADTYYNRAVPALAAVQSTLQRLPAKTRSQMRDDFSESQAVTIHQVGLPDVFASKVYKYVENGASPLFGMEKKPMSDITFVPDEIGNPDQTNPIILSNGKIDRGTTNSYAGLIETSTLPPVMKKTATLNYAWKSNGQVYTAKVDMQKVDPKTFFPKGTSPDYKGIWSDGRLAGAVVVGDNMRDHPLVIDQYQEYYERNGYKKTSQATIKNFDQYLLNQMKDGSIDYFVKEAHSDGDLENVFSTAKTVIAKTFTKNVNGKEETVTLYFPDPKDLSHTLISNADFGNAIQTREKDGKQELIYLNTSCWSEKKAHNEILTAQSPKLVDISVTTMASMFSGGNQKPIGRLLTGIREQKSYQWMQDQVDASSSASSEDKYVVPGTKKFMDLFNPAGAQVNTQIQVTAVGQ
jgi:hypothetical protein